MLEVQTKPAPAGIIDCLSAGFSTVAQKLNLLLIPIALDLFLWLGPRLSVSPLVTELTARFRAVAGEIPQDSAAFIEQNIAETFGSYNLFSALSTWPLGVPSLLAGPDLPTSPLGTPPLVPVLGLNALLAWVLPLSLLGLLLGSLHMGLVARAVKGKHSSLKTWFKHTWRHWTRIVTFVLLALWCSFCLSAPFFLLIEVIAVIAPPLASLALLAGVGMGMWALYHLLFTVHGILLDDMHALQAMRYSIKLVCQNRASSVGLVLITAAISLGLSDIWNLPSPNSWLRLVAIAGNAFINTGLIAATFVYYRERSPGLPKVGQEEPCEG
jgi:hypothetical protein